MCYSGKIKGILMVSTLNDDAVENVTRFIKGEAQKLFRNLQLYVGMKTWMVWTQQTIT